MATAISTLGFFFGSNLLPTDQAAERPSTATTWAWDR